MPVDFCWPPLLEQDRSRPRERGFTYKQPNMAPTLALHLWKCAVGALRLTVAARPRPLVPIQRLAGPSSIAMSKHFSSTPRPEWKGGERNPRAKLKTHKGAMKRFRATKEGQFVRVRNDPPAGSSRVLIGSQAQTGTSHLMVGTSRGVRRRLKPRVVVHPTHHTLLRKLLPYEGSRGAFRRLEEQELTWWKSGRLQKKGTALDAAITRARTQGTPGQPAAPVEDKVSA